jgi:hypothetical protein
MDRSLKEIDLLRFALDRSADCCSGPPSAFIGILEPILPEAMDTSANPIAQRYRQWSVMEKLSSL